MTDPFGRLISTLCEGNKVMPEHCVGGAPRFLNVIVGEVLPLLLRRYPIDPERLGLFGISAGGFFASWAMFQPTSPFSKHLICSPVLAYGDGEIFRSEARYVATDTDLRARVYFGAGALERADTLYEGMYQIVSGMTRLDAALRGRNYPMSSPSSTTG